MKCQEFPVVGSFRDIMFNAIQTFPETEVQANPKVIHSEGLQHILRVFLLLLNGFSPRVHYLSFND